MLSSNIVFVSVDWDTSTGGGGGGGGGGCWNIGELPNCSNIKTRDLEHNLIVVFSKTYETQTLREPSHPFYHNDDFFALFYINIYL